jgi:hypothetical protein
VTTGTDDHRYRIVRHSGKWCVESQVRVANGWEPASWRGFYSHEEAKAYWWSLLHPKGRRRSLGQVQPDSQPASLPQAP